MSENVPARVTDEVSKEASARNLALDYDHVLKFTAGDTTPSVKNLTRFRGADSVVTITNFDNGQQGQRIHILGDDKTDVANNATIKRTTSGTLRINSIYSFQYVSGIWYENVSASAGVRVYHSVNQSLTSGAFEALNFDLERFDTSSFHSTSSNNSRLTVPSAGKYLIGGCVLFESNANGNRRLRVRLNGTTYIVAQEHPIVSAVSFSVNVSTLYELAAGDYVELVAFQNTGGNLNVLASGNTGSEFWLALF